MNKDVVYIEPEDDITDIIARVKNAKQKLVALVPPKKIGVLRSAVNTKLIAKAAKANDKIVVIVTTDPSLVKLSAAAQIPIAKTLQSRPKLPSEIIEETKDSGEQIIDENDFDDEEIGQSSKSALAKSGASANGAKGANNGNGANAQRSKNQGSKPDQEISSDDIENDRKKKNGKKGDKKNIPALEKYRKWIIIGGIALVGLIIFLVWAFVFAPAANIAVAIRTTTNNFSENVSFVTNRGSEKPSEGIFLLEQQKVEKTNSVEFTATGEKNIGETATGSISLAAYLNTVAGVPLRILEGVTFTHGDYTYVVTDGTSISYAGSDKECENFDEGNVSTKGCLKTAVVKVKATQPGSAYNIGAYDSGWSTNADTSMAKSYSISNASAFAGGTDKTVTVVSESDFNKAKDKLNNEGREDGRSELNKLFGDDMIVIESSLEVSTSNPKSNPAVGEEVKSGVTPKIEATTTYMMFAVDRTTLEDYIKSKAEAALAPDQKIYAVDTPFFENFQKSNDGQYTAKLKSSTQTGPKVTEEDILEKSRGKKTGEVQSLLKSINGVSSVKITTSFPWVNTVPDDPNKITIELKVEE